MHGYPLSEFINIPTAEHDMSKHDMSEHDLHNLSYHLGPEYCVSGDPSVGSAAMFRSISGYFRWKSYFLTGLGGRSGSESRGEASKLGESVNA